MQIDLKANNINSLEFSTKLTLSSNQIEAIHKISPPGGDGSSDFWDSYQNNRSFGWITKADMKTLQAQLVLMYEARKGGNPGKKRARINQLIEVLSSSEQQLSFECRVTFVFHKRMHAKSILHLPQKYLDIPNMPFDKIQGMHLVKLEGSETKYDVFLEAPAEGVIAENVLFNYKTQINNDLASKILNEALNISDKFIIKE